jgi:RimJ/RimL family protein N-acetyltransferase
MPPRAAAAVELITERLLLRDFTPDDRAALLAYQGDPRYLEFYGPDEGGPESTVELLAMFLAWQAEEPRQNYQLAIVERAASPALIGCCGVRQKGFEAGVAEFGLELASQCWGRGLASEAARAMLAFAFQDLGAREVLAVTVTQNHRVARLLERLGFRACGTRDGAGWMRERGLSETEWRLSAAQWVHPEGVVARG